jgi:glycosyltransferase involved in cell wall biosynthesis
MKLGIVVPCFNEEAVLPETVGRLGVLLDRLHAAGKVAADSRIYLVDDGSSDATWRLIEEWHGRDGRFIGIKLSRNRGHQNALLAGLMTAQGDALVSIDADLQDDVNAIEAMVDACAAGHDLVYGVRRERETDTAFKRATAEGYYRLLHLFGVEVVFNHADFRLMSRRAIEALREFQEINLFLRGIVPLLGFRSTCVYYDRSERFAGESKYPLRKMLSLATNGITSFTAMPLRLIAGIGLLLFFVSILLALWVVWAKLFTDSVVPGWTSIVIPMYLLGGLQLLGIGVVGEYVAKVYLESKRRPRYIIEKITSEFEKNDQGTTECAHTLKN